MSDRRRACVVVLTAALAALPGLARAADRPGAGCGGAFKVALDVGHTLSQPGATSATGVPEFTYNQRLARAVDGALRRGGIATVLIGEDGAPLALVARSRQAQAAGASLFLSLHHDSVQPQYLSTWTVGGQSRPYSDVFRGYSVFVSNAGREPPGSLRFAALLGGAMREAGFRPSMHHALPVPGEGRPVVDATLGIFRFDGLAVLRTATMPAALLEAAIIVNRGEEEMTKLPATLDRFASAVANSVRRYCAGSR
jgi:N-acetylmuramoyl-L-alanine amidase